MGFSVATGTALLEGLLNGVAIPLPAGLHIGLHVGGSAPNDDGTGVVEPPTANGYARLDEQGNFTATAAGSRIHQNDNNLLWGQATNANWGSVTHIVFFEATAGGVYRGSYALQTARQIDVGDSLQIDAGSLQISFVQV